MTLINSLNPYSIQFFNDVHKFMLRYGQCPPSNPIPSPRRLAWLASEYKELVDAVFMPTDTIEQQQVRIAAILDALTDIQYIFTGFTVEGGILNLSLVYSLVGFVRAERIELNKYIRNVDDCLIDCWNCVHQANMAKVWTSENIKTMPDRYTCTDVGDNLYIVRDATGKVMKPPTWQAPDLLPIVKRYWL